MKKMRKPEGELLESVFSDDFSNAQKLLNRCKEVERLKNMKVVRVSNFTWYLLPQGTNIENWKARKFV